MAFLIYTCNFMKLGNLLKELYNYNAVDDFRSSFRPLSLILWLQILWLPNKTRQVEVLAHIQRSSEDIPWSTWVVYPNA